jgi:hypothetical protein
MAAGATLPMAEAVAIATAGAGASPIAG